MQSWVLLLIEHDYLFMNFKKSKLAIFIMPRSSSAWEGAEALWITVAGWAEAAKRNLGDSVVITSDRIAAPREVYKYPLKPKNRDFRKKQRYLFLLPVFLRVILGDLLTWKNNRNWKVLEDLDSADKEVAFVWEKHDLFEGPGRKLASKLQVPFIIYVHAPIVWEAEKWGVKRFWWGKFLEKKEAAALRKAEYVAVVSDEVKEKCLRMGVASEKIFISPMAVDPVLFESNNCREKAKSLSAKLKLDRRVVIGWTGSFRNFHGLDHLIRAFHAISERYPDSYLLLVGDGTERNKMMRLVKELGISDRVLFAGRKPFSEIPVYVSLFDVAVVSARTGEGFHYSPLKLREYMAAGKAVLAPAAGEIPHLFENERHLKLFKAGDIKSLEKGLEFFLEDEIKRKEISCRGKKMIGVSGTWDIELEKAMKKISH